MKQVMLVEDDEDFRTFCAAMNKAISCKTPHCDKTCPAAALRAAQKSCEAGKGIRAAVFEWATTGLTHEDGEEILAHAIGVPDLELARRVLDRG